MVETLRSRKATDPEPGKGSSNYPGGSSETNSSQVGSVKYRRVQAAQALFERRKSLRAANLLPSPKLSNPEPSLILTKQRKKHEVGSIPIRRPVKILEKEVNASKPEPVNLVAKKLKAAHGEYTIIDNAHALITKLDQDHQNAITALEATSSQFAHLDAQFNHPKAPNLTLPFYCERMEAWKAIAFVEVAIRDIEGQQERARQALVEAGEGAAARREVIEQWRDPWRVLEMYVTRLAGGKGGKKPRSRIPEDQRVVLDEVEKVLGGGRLVMGWWPRVHLLDVTLRFRMNTACVSTLSTLGGEIFINHHVLSGLNY